ncbi:AraC-type DNA-binding protein [Paenibacillus sp. UNCCL117]|uniref:AraC family transcriptional regulator n=1 Tax=unclassified Paenibacillus TaxID=185978 RepID=UPI0008844C48|nr:MULTISPECIES: AraC family transcriptional regulator [unclassified Paenibacillus]SDD58590.1 AraC-type DNA-binding protein [Paenibacillus sp. cl123]SFW50985.1 AraC-type DNA-binding protein [Paenibacillus sp. UNCCL117]
MCKQPNGEGADAIEIVELSIPPLPQFLTAGRAVWKPGMQHFSRCFEVYDLLLVSSGTMYMTEENRAYEVKAGESLLLEPGKLHTGHKPTEEPTEIYWVHFKHNRPLRRLPGIQSIPWHDLVNRGSDHDLTPPRQSLFLPKYGPVAMHGLIPLLEQILQLRDSLTMEHAIQLQLALNGLLAKLQDGLKGRRSESRSYLLSEQVKSYLRERLDAPFRAAQLSERLHFDFDYLARCLKKHTGLSPIQYQQLLRVEEAKRLLAHSGLTVTEIGAAVGIPDCNYFVRLFRRTVGMAPGAYRRAARSLGAPDEAHAEELRTKKL